MPQAKFDTIFRELRERVEDGTYAFQSFLPSENTLTAEFDCSRNTVRRAIARNGKLYIDDVDGTKADAKRYLRK